MEINIFLERKNCYFLNNIFKDVHCNLGKKNQINMNCEAISQELVQAYPLSEIKQTILNREGGFVAVPPATADVKGRKRNFNFIVLNGNIRGGRGVTLAIIL